MDALAITVSSHITTAAADVGYLPKSAALDILKKLSSYARLHFKDWHTFSEKFLEENIMLG
ncbi:hypothetical protein [Sphingobacterium sp. E70]|uniref:hypothetical protein n=1 Tax=Sphingobacterium sp. E70 TaxID=2853439 RepID=UPI00359CB209